MVGNRSYQLRNLLGVRLEKYHRSGWEAPTGVIVLVLFVLYPIVSFLGAMPVYVMSQIAADTSLHEPLKTHSTQFGLVIGAIVAALVGLWLAGMRWRATYALVLELPGKSIMVLAGRERDRMLELDDRIRQAMNEPAGGNYVVNIANQELDLRNSQGVQLNYGGTNAQDNRYRPDA